MAQIVAMAVGQSASGASTTNWRFYKPSKDYQSRRAGHLLNAGRAEEATELRRTTPIRSP